MLKSTQQAYINFWVIVVIIAEAMMILLNNYLFVIYLVIASLFFIGFLLRLLRLYPGKEEPLLLDSSAVAIALLFAYASGFFKFSGIRFILILISSLIIVPHIVYIVSNENIE